MNPPNPNPLSNSNSSRAEAMPGIGLPMEDLTIPLNIKFPRASSNKFEFDVSPPIEYDKSSDWFIRMYYLYMILGPKSC